YPRVVKSRNISESTCDNLRRRKPSGAHLTFMSIFASRFENFECSRNLLNDSRSSGKTPTVPSRFGKKSRREREIQIRRNRRRDMRKVRRNETALWIAGVYYSVKDYEKGLDWATKLGEEVSLKERLRSYFLYRLGNFSAAVAASEQAVELGPEDVDLALCHDAFANEELEYYELLGFCPEGDGEKLLEEGATQLGGRIPFNTDGGLIARGHPGGPTGLAQIHELALQLRGEAGPRQVANARIGLAHLVGGGSVCTVNLLKRN
ncbi:MAG: thiolase family protein, partial [Myxococcales bacterium]|nr:thiolase family protein [Myxococcales bacterium]